MTQPRARYRFGLRYLLLFMFVLAIPLARLAWLRSEGRRHERWASELHALGGDCQFSHRKWVPAVSRATTMAFGGGTPLEETSTLPDVVERWGLALALRRIANVTLRKNTDLPAAIGLLKQLGQLEHLSIYDAHITQTQWAELLGHVQVHKLYLEAAPLPRTNLEWLRHDGLTWLCVARTQFSNPALTDLPLSLEYLDATRTRINDDGLPALVRLQNLKSLNLSRTPTSQLAIEQLRREMPWCEIRWEPLENR